MAQNVAPMTLSSFSMEQKVCVVTGAARGLGFEFCKAFLQSGCTSIILLDLKESECNEAVEDLTVFAVEGCGFSADVLELMSIACDVSSEESVQKAFSTVIDRYGKLDAVVASAGIVENYPALDYPADRARRLFDVNVHGVFFTAREAARNMISNGGGSIILISSMSANIVNIPQTQAPYNASKAAVKHLAASLAVEWAPYGVRVNALSPGYMLTKLTRTILERNVELKNTWEKLTPMGRMGEPQDLSGAIIFLASDASKFMTGSEIRVDGGYCAV